VHAEPSDWLHKFYFYFQQTVCHHFWPGLTARAQIYFIQCGLFI
jgi:hypothetical protein